MLAFIRHEIDHKQFDPERYRKGSFNFGIAWENYIKKLKSPYKETVECIYKHHLKSAFSHKDFRKINTNDIEEFYQALLLKVPSAAQYMKVLKAALRWMYRAKDIRYNPPYFHELPGSNRREGYLSQDEQTAVYNAFPEAYRPYLLFCMTYGCRPVEARKLQWQDIHWKEQEVIIHHAKKGKPSAKPLMPHIKEMLESLPRNLSGLVFTNKKGKPICQILMAQIWNKVCLQTIGRKVTFYEGTRHTRATLAAIAGAPINTIKELLGHSSVNHTQRYMKFSSDGMKGVVLDMNREQNRDTDGIRKTNEP
jgi:integrase